MSVKAQKRSVSVSANMSGVSFTEMSVFTICCTEGLQTFGRQDVWATDVWATIFFQMTIWATRVGRLGDSNWTFGRQS